MHGSQEALGMLSPMDGAADKLLKGDLSGAVKEAAIEAGGGRVFKAAGKGLAAVKRHAGKLDEAVGALSHADDAATATATGVRESIEEASSVLAKEGGGVANSGGNLLNQTYCHATPSTLGEVRALNRLNYDRAAPDIVRMRGTQLFDDAGNAVNGRYNQATNQVFLGKGSNLGTLTEELIHAGQRIDYGGRIPTNMIRHAEQQAAKQLNRLGFEVVDP